MKFNPNCIRDILITVEENTGYEQDISIGEDSSIYPLLQKYDAVETMYHIDQCIQNGLINGKKNIWGQFRIAGLTPGGHSLLGKIRSEKLWKEILSRGVSAIPTLIEIAALIAG
ncbi:MAG: DUF2513 domain-containing protein [Lacrimispora sphenoides]